jgi:hypothetical protein
MAIADTTYADTTRYKHYYVVKKNPSYSEVT